MRPPPPELGRTWAMALAALGLVLVAPFLLRWTPLAILAGVWGTLLLVALILTVLGAIIGVAAQATVPAHSLVERLLRRWVARFSPDSEGLWLYWAAQASRARMGDWCLGRAVALGGREAQFQEALAFLEGGLGHGGQSVGLERLRRAALRGHPEAAFRLAEVLRSGGQHLPRDAAEALTWYRRSADLGYAAAALWLAQAHATGDGVPVDPVQAATWTGVATRLGPAPPLSRSLLRHDTAPEDALERLLVQISDAVNHAAERVVGSRRGRRALFLVSGVVVAYWLLGLIALVIVLWVGSSGLFHLPLLIALPPLVVLTWRAWRLRREGPRRGRDKLREAAEVGDPEACHSLAVAHRLGSAVHPKDPLAAAVWFRKAAEGGHREAMLALAEAHRTGHGVLRDPQEAARWAEAARPESTSARVAPMES